MPRAMAVASSACPKLVKDMHYEARIQAVISYYAKYRDEKVDKTVARTMTLTREQYLPVLHDLYLVTLST